MKILFNSIGYNKNLPLNLQGDYQINFLLHGFRQLFGADVVDFPRVEHMYYPFPDKLGLWGKGMSYAETLSNIDINRDPDHIQRQIIDGEFDILTLGVHHMAHHQPDQLYSALDWLVSVGCKSKIIVVDGNDHRSTYLDVFKYPLDITLFKREIPDGMDERVKSISFAVPADRVLKKVPIKTKMLATILPADFDSENRKTHSYNSEAEYYNDYQSAWFGMNSEKGGFDSCRIREIAMNGCIPIFTNIEQCPSRTLCDLPKQELLAVKNIQGLILKQKVFTKHDIQRDSVLFSDDINTNELQEWAEFFLEYTRNNFTTEALANRVLGEINI